MPKFPSNKDDENEETNKENATSQEVKVELPSFPLQPTAGFPPNPSFPDDQGPGYLTEGDIPSEIKSLPKGQPGPGGFDEEPVENSLTLSNLDPITGYESATFEETLHTPPASYMMLSNQAQPKRDPVAGIPQITAEESRLCLLQYASSHCCYSKQPAKDLVVTELLNTSTCLYSLESFTEHRQTSWTYTAYTDSCTVLGGVIDSCMNGPAPAPWDIAIHTPTYFVNSVVETEIPHTASVKTCVMCSGYGRKKCNRCYGHGFEKCHHCLGESHDDSHERCYYCHGHGKKQCWKCNGQGVMMCSTCQSTGQIKCYIKLTIKWENHCDDELIEYLQIPEDLFRKATSLIAFEEELPKLWPLNHFPDTRVNEKSIEITNKHLSQFTNCRILRQRQRVKIIPVARITFKWKNHNGCFYVCGNEKLVHAPDYPQNCCCGICAIL
ncbi:Protein SSUH2 [Nymphon striatum]|nr:Protein SSUH2 [Nymphon striatum]